MTPSRFLLTLLLCAACTGVRAQPYVDLVDFPTEEANWDRFYALEWRLMRQFEDICPDTFCEGAYSNLLPLQLRCSVRTADASVQACTWVFAASNLEVDADSGHVQVDNRTWECPAPLASGTPVEAFHAALTGPRALYTPLPGLGVSLYAAIGDCFRQRAPHAAVQADAVHHKGIFR